MGPYVSFSDDVVLDGATSQEGSLEDLTGVTIPRNALPASTSTSTEEEPTEKPAPTEVTTTEAAPSRKPLKGPTHLPVTIDNPTVELTALQVQHEEQMKVEDPHSGFPSWTKVLHPPRPVMATEEISQPLVS